MNNILEWLVTAEDPRQQAKVKHLMKDIIVIVFFAQGNLLTFYKKHDIFKDDF